MTEEEIEEAGSIEQRKRAVFQVPKQLGAAQANHAAHALRCSYRGANMVQPLALVRVEQMRVRLPQQHAGDLPADVAGVVKA
jgi:hypothetical protein